MLNIVAELVWIKSQMFLSYHQLQHHNHLNRRVLRVLMRFFITQHMLYSSKAVLITKVQHSSTGEVVFLIL